MSFKVLPSVPSAVSNFTADKNNISKNKTYAFAKCDATNPSDMYRADKLSHTSLSTAETLPHKSLRSNHHYQEQVTGNDKENARHAMTLPSLLSNGELKCVHSATTRDLTSQKPEIISGHVYTSNNITDTTHMNITDNSKENASNVNIDNNYKKVLGVFNGEHKKQIWTEENCASCACMSDALSQRCETLIMESGMYTLHQQERRERNSILTTEEEKIFKIKWAESHERARIARNLEINNERRREERTQRRLKELTYLLQLRVSCVNEESTLRKEIVFAAQDDFERIAQMCEDAEYKYKVVQLHTLQRASTEMYRTTAHLRHWQGKIASMSYRPPKLISLTESCKTLHSPSSSPPPHHHHRVHSHEQYNNKNGIKQCESNSCEIECKHMGTEQLLTSNNLLFHASDIISGTKSNACFSSSSSCPECQRECEEGEQEQKEVKEECAVANKRSERLIDAIVLARERIARQEIECNEQLFALCFNAELTKLISLPYAEERERNAHYKLRQIGACPVRLTALICIQRWWRLLQKQVWSARRQECLRSALQHYRFNLPASEWQKRLKRLCKAPLRKINSVHESEEACNQLLPLEGIQSFKKDEKVKNVESTHMEVMSLAVQLSEEDKMKVHELMRLMKAATQWRYRLSMEYYLFTLCSRAQDYMAQALFDNHTLINNSAANTNTLLSHCYVRCDEGDIYARMRYSLHALLPKRVDTSFELRPYVSWRRCRWNEASMLFIRHVQIILVEETQSREEINEHEERDFISLRLFQRALACSGTDDAACTSLLTEWGKFAMKEENARVWLEHKEEEIFLSYMFAGAQLHTFAKNKQCERQEYCNMEEITRNVICHDELTSWQTTIATVEATFWQNLVYARQRLQRKKFNGKHQRTWMERYLQYDKYALHHFTSLNSVANLLIRFMRRCVRLACHRKHKEQLHILVEEQNRQNKMRQYIMTLQAQEQSLINDLHALHMSEGINRSNNDDKKQVKIISLSNDECNECTHNSAISAINVENENGSSHTAVNVHETEMSVALSTCLEHPPALHQEELESSEITSTLGSSPLHSNIKMEVEEFCKWFDKEANQPRENEYKALVRRYHAIHAPFFHLFNAFITIMREEREQISNKENYERRILCGSYTYYVITVHGILEKEANARAFLCADEEDARYNCYRTLQSMKELIRWCANGENMVVTSKRYAMHNSLPSNALDGKTVIPPVQPTKWNEEYNSKESTSEWSTQQTADHELSPFAKITNRILKTHQQCRPINYKNYELPVLSKEQRLREREDVCRTRIEVERATFIASMLFAFSARERQAIEENEKECRHDVCVSVDKLGCTEWPLAQVCDLVYEEETTRSAFESMALTSFSSPLERAHLMFLRETLLPRFTLGHLLMSSEVEYMNRRLATLLVQRLSRIDTKVNDLILQESAARCRLEYIETINRELRFQHQIVRYEKKKLPMK